MSGIIAKGSANLAENMWITDGSEATVPGMHQLSTPVNFSYGFQQAGDTHYMDSGPNAGQTLTLAQVKTDFAGHNVLVIVPSGGKVIVFAI